MSTLLEPAASIIAKFGGPERVQEITGASRTRVYRWTQPQTVGGTGGVIPLKQANRLLSHAREAGIEVNPAEFFSPAPSSEQAA